jgi:methyl-accepting chemotaxis protein
MMLDARQSILDSFGRELDLLTERSTSELRIEKESLERLISAVASDRGLTESLVAGRASSDISSALGRLTDGSRFVNYSALLDSNRAPIAEKSINGGAIAISGDISRSSGAHFSLHNKTLVVSVALDSNGKSGWLIAQLPLHKVEAALADSMSEGTKARVLSEQASLESSSDMESQAPAAFGDVMLFVHLSRSKALITADLQRKTFWAGLGVIVLVGLTVLSAWIYINRKRQGLIKSFEGLFRINGHLGGLSSDLIELAANLNRSVDQQSATVQETSSAMAEMNGMLGQTASLAQETAEVAHLVTRKAEDGSNVMQQMVDSMASIEQANEQLLRMVKLIDEIANKTQVINDIVFKTQLLSFNASIEAARAGQHGRGFAVVAEEVGNLAKMSGEAAETISQLLADSQRQVTDIVANTRQRVDLGKTVSEQARRNFTEISQSIAGVSERIERMSAASREQEQGVNQTVVAMSELGKSAKHTTAIADNCRRNSDHLRQGTKTLGFISSGLQLAIFGQVIQETAARQLGGPGDANQATEDTGVSREAA